MGEKRGVLNLEIVDGVRRGDLFVILGAPIAERPKFLPTGIDPRGLGASDAAGVNVEAVT